MFVPFVPFPSLLDEGRNEEGREVLKVDSCVVGSASLYLVDWWVMGMRRRYFTQIHSHWFAWVGSIA